VSTALAEAPTGRDEKDTKGKLFEMPKIEVDDSNPTAVTIAFSGSVTLDRSQQSDIDLYNRLKAGKVFDLQVSGFVKGPKTTHRRDSEGNVDAVMQTKSLVIDSIDNV
jgi:hypothetical protein